MQSITFSQFSEKLLKIVGNFENHLYILQEILKNRLYNLYGYRNSNTCRSNMVHKYLQNIPGTAILWPLNIAKTLGGVLDTSQTDKFPSTELQHNRDFSLFANLTIVTDAECWKVKPNYIYNKDCVCCCVFRINLKYIYFKNQTG